MNKRSCRLKSFWKASVHTHSQTLRSHVPYVLLLYTLTQPNDICRLIKYLHMNDAFTRAHIQFSKCFNNKRNIWFPNNTIRKRFIWKIVFRLSGNANLNIWLQWQHNFHLKMDFYKYRHGYYWMWDKVFMFCVYYAWTEVRLLSQLEIAPLMNGRMFCIKENHGEIAFVICTKAAHKLFANFAQSKSEWLLKHMTVIPM